MNVAHNGVSSGWSQTAVVSRAMSSDLATSLLTGAFGLGGGLGGVLLSSGLAQRGERRRLTAEDERRWLADRRGIYASYLGLAESMHKEIDRFAVFLSYDGTKAISDEEEEMIGESLREYFMKWEDELQPALGQVRLMGTPKVVDLAERVAVALMEITSEVELRKTFTDYYPGWFQVGDLLRVLLNAMRKELGLPETSSSRDQDWPWLPERPSRESYVQKHPRPSAEAQG
ncbi:MAG: hypothetical protein JWO67_2476 [Streptosporangiaceae bacterium]|nr:hypothetical protein [Streptosporangiaceae bacterium]